MALLGQLEEAAEEAEAEEARSGAQTVTPASPGEVLRVRSRFLTRVRGAASALAMLAGMV